MPQETHKDAARRLSATMIANGYLPKALHCYTARDGTPIYWRIRLKHPGTGDKWIRPMHANGQGYKLGEPSFAGKKPLYRLHELVAADPARACWFVEGEQKADALAGLGLLATTTGSATSDDACDFEPLRGRRVIIWPDNDVPGQEHATRVAKTLRGLGSSVESVDLAPLTLAEHGDVIDWLASHPNAAAKDLMALARLREGAGATPSVRLLRADGVALEPVRWLWRWFLPAGMFTILGGAPGCGKTTIALSLAASVTGGGMWPDGTRCDQPGDVIVWSGEDPHTVTAARLAAAGAEMKRAHLIDGVTDGAAFDPGRDMPLLESTLAGLSAPRLLILDPIVSAVAGDSHKGAEVRRSLQPVVDLANRLGCAVLGITHFTKGTAGRDPIERVTGSIAFAALARLVLVAAKVKPETGEDGEPRRILMRAKSNIGPDDGGFAYALERVEVADEVEGQRVRWLEALDGTARELLADAEADPADDHENGARDCAGWLREFLAAGPVPVREVKRCADEAGYAWRTVQRAMRRAGADSRRGGFGKPAEWFLIASRATVAPIAPHMEAGANGANGAASGATDAVVDDAEVI